MCRTYTNKEEVVIAQSGANNASQSSLEHKMETYGIIIATLVAVIVIVIGCIWCRRCNRKIKTWARREVASAMSMSQLDKVGLQSTPVQSQPMQYQA